MIIKSKITSENRKTYFTVLGACAQFALVLAIFLSRLETTGLDFFIGVLTGFSIVGNLAYLTFVSRNYAKNRSH